MNKHRQITILFLFLFISNLVFSQTEQTAKVRPVKVGLQYMSLVIHTFKTSHPERYDLRLDKHGYTVLIPGVVANVDWYYNEKQNMHLRFEGAWYKDSGFNDAGYVHLAIRRGFFKKQDRKWHVTAGIGPAFFLRQNWNALYPGRVSDPFYGDRISKNGEYQYRFFPIGGEVDFILKMNERWDFDLSLVPGAPAAIIIKLGARYAIGNVKRTKTDRFFWDW